MWGRGSADASTHPQRNLYSVLLTIHGAALAAFVKKISSAVGSTFEAEAVASVTACLAYTNESPTARSWWYGSRTQREPGGASSQNTKWVPEDKIDTSVRYMYAIYIPLGLLNNATPAKAAFALVAHR